MMKKKYKGIDLFCGIGGFRLAMKSNNVKCVTTIIIVPKL